MAASQDDCLLDSLIANNGVDPATYEASPGAVFNNPNLNTLLTGISPLGYSGLPRTPILFYHAVHDQFAPLAEMEHLAARYCDERISVGVRTSPDGDHISYVTSGFPTALQYVTDRFRGEAAPNDCQEQADASAAGDASSTPASSTDASSVGAVEMATGAAHSSGCGCAIEDQRSSKGTAALVVAVAMLFSRRRSFRKSGALTLD